MLTKEQAIILLEEAKRNKKFTEFEVMFAKSILMKKTLRVLSPKQEAIVNKIYEKSTGGGDKVFNHIQ